MPRARTLALASALGLWAGLAPASGADEPLPLPPGTPIRVTAPAVSSGWLTGTLAAASDSEIVLALPGGERKAIPRSQVTRLEWSPGRHGHAGGGALIGAVIGAAFFGYVSLALCDAASCSVNGAAVAAGLALGALPGAGVGALIRTPSWREAPPASLRVALAPVRGRGVGLAVRLSF